MAMMPSPVTAVMAKSPAIMALPSQIVDSTITNSDKQLQQHQQKQQTAAKYLTSVKSSPHSPSSSPQSPPPPPSLEQPALLHQTSSTVPSAAASLTISSATALSSVGGYHSNLISRISNSMNSSSNNSTIKDKVQISCNLSQDMEATGSKNNNNLRNETSVNLNLTHNNNNIINNNNLNLINNNNTSMHTHSHSHSHSQQHGSSNRSSSIMNDATAASTIHNMSSTLLDDNCCPSKMGSSSPLNFLRFSSVGYGTEVNNSAVVNCLSENALNLSSMGKNSEMTVTATPLISSGIVQSRMTTVTGMPTSLRNDENSDLMRRGNFGRN